MGVEHFIFPVHDWGEDSRLESGLAIGAPVAVTLPPISTWLRHFSAQPGWTIGVEENGEQVDIRFPANLELPGQQEWTTLKFSQPQLIVVEGWLDNLTPALNALAQEIGAFAISVAGAEVECFPRAEEGVIS